MTHAPFLPTQWTLVLTAARSHPGQAASLASLCHTYWYPLYSAIRRAGHAPHDAQDLTQDFFSRLLDSDMLASVDPAKGKFRTYLLACLGHFLSNARDHARAQKRSPGKTLLSLSLPTDSAILSGAEARFTLDPSHNLTPEKLFDRQWAIATLDQVLATLAAEYQTPEEKHLFETLKPYLIAAPDSLPYAQSAQSLGLSEGAIKVAVHRLRKRYRLLLRNQIAQTVSTPEEIDQEIRDLFNALRP
jgi:RNA polymerase sigma factor (sigma-70 family)